MVNQECPIVIDDLETKILLLVCHWWLDGDDVCDWNLQVPVMMYLFE